MKNKKPSNSLKRRLVAWLLVMMMLIGVFPTTAFAQEETAQSGTEVQTETESQAVEQTEDIQTDTTKDTGNTQPTQPDAEVVSENAGDTGAAVQAAGGDPNNLTLSHPRLTVDDSDGLGKTFNACSTKGYMARLHFESTEDAGVNGVWIGYRFTVKVPDGMGKDYVKFTDVSYSWLKKMDGTSTSTQTYDEATRTWTLEGKYYYDNAGNPLGSSGAKEYSRSISLSSTYLEKGQTVTPTMEAWLIDKTGDTPQKVNGETVTVDVKGQIHQGILDGYPQAKIGGYYSPSLKKFFSSSSEAKASGAKDLILGRVVILQTYWNTKSGSALIKDGTEFPFSIKLTSRLNGATVTAKDMQPILLGARFDNKKTPDNVYKDALADGDMTLGGRVGTAPSQSNITPIIRDVTYSNNTIKGHVGITGYSGTYPTGINEMISAGFVVFVPLSENDKDTDKRTLTISNDPIPDGTVISGDVTTKDNSGSSWTMLVPNVKMAEGSGAKAWGNILAMNGQLMDYRSRALGEVAPVLSNIKSLSDDSDHEVNAFDALVKVDTEAFEFNTTVKSTEPVRNDYVNSGGKITVKYGVLPGGGGWTSRDQMLSTQKEQLTYYDPGQVPADTTVVAVLLQGRGGKMSGGSARTAYNGMFVKKDIKLSGRAFDIVQDSYIWLGKANPDTDNPTVHQDATGYQSAVWDDNGNETEGWGEKERGDTILITGYQLNEISADNLNGTNKTRKDGYGTDKAALNSSTYDVVAGERTATFRHTFSITSEAGGDDPNAEFYITYSVTRTTNNVNLLQDSIKLDADYTPGDSDTKAGIISGGSAPISCVEWQNASGSDKRYNYTFKVTGTGKHTINGTYQLGDALDPDNDVAVGSINISGHFWVDKRSGTSLKSALRNSDKGLCDHFVIVKSNAAGFRKVAADQAIKNNSEARYQLVLSPQDQDLTGSLLLDVFPFNNDGRGTKLSDGASITVDKELELTVRDANKSVRTVLNLYYTTDAAIQKHPLPTVADLKRQNISGETATVLGVTWKKATLNKVDDTHYKYKIASDAKAILGVGMVGQNESPYLDMYLKLNNTKPDDSVSNSAGFDANEFGKPMNSSTASTNVADRVIKGKAWIDANGDGKQDAAEKGLAGLTVKLYQGDTEIMQDELGNTYHVTTDQAGNYSFDHVPSSAEKYHVVFSGGNISKYAVSPKTASGVADDKNSDVTGDPAITDPATETLVRAKSDEVDLMTLETQNNTQKYHDEKQLDAGFAPKYVVAFDTNGGTPDTIDAQTVVAGNQANKPADPKKENYIFEGWAYDKGGDGTPATTWNFGDKVLSDLNLVAQWKEAPAASVSIQGIKTLTGGGKTSADIKAGQFAFQVTQTAGDTSAVSGLPTGAVKTSAGTNTGATLDFGTWSFAKTGTYSFTIVEDTPAAGYTKAADATVNVTVTQNPDSGALEAAVTYSTGDKLTFENTYTAPDGVKEALSGTKTLTENGAPKAFTDGQFSVAIAEDPTNDKNGYTGFTAGNKDIAANGTFQFDELTFVKAGTYKFRITENDLGAVGYTYDNQAVTATYKVKLDATDNQLKVDSLTYEKGGKAVKGIQFENTYATPKASDVTISGTKTLTENGQDKAMKVGQFSFEIKEDQRNDTDGYTGFQAGTADVAENGSFTFGTLTFVKEGTYKFQITEEDKKAAGYTYDDKEVELTVTVTLNTATNELEAVASYEKDGKAVDQLTFENTYTTPNPAKVDLDGKVTLDGNKKTQDITAGEFKFTVIPDVGNDADGYTGLETRQDKRWRNH